jgi:hypothetical protein
MSRGIQKDSQSTCIVNSLQMGVPERAGPIAARLGLPYATVHAALFQRAKFVKDIVRTAQGFMRVPAKPTGRNPRSGRTADLVVFLRRHGEFSTRELGAYFQYDAADVSSLLTSRFRGNGSHLRRIGTGRWAALDAAPIDPVVPSDILANAEKRYFEFTASPAAAASAGFDPIKQRGPRAGVTAKPMSRRGIVCSKAAPPYNPPFRALDADAARRMGAAFMPTGQGIAYVGVIAR